MSHLVYRTLALFKIFAQCCTACSVLGRPANSASNPSPQREPGWQSEFDFTPCTMVTTGQNTYFILEPGFQLVLEGGNEVLAITVLDETIEIDGVHTRMVEEREWKNGELIEV